MANEKRKPRSYKIADKPYLKALKMQKNPPLATFIEGIVIALSEGATIMALRSTENSPIIPTTKRKTK